jgi:hypothetical protein
VDSTGDRPADREYGQNISGVGATLTFSPFTAMVELPHVRLA